MVGDDAATAEFSAAWNDPSVVPEGSSLVYSTGRSLESFAQLIAEKSAVMAAPCHLICAVGTKIYKRKPGVEKTAAAAADVSSWVSHRESIDHERHAQMKMLGHAPLLGNAGRGAKGKNRGGHSKRH